MIKLIATDLDGTLLNDDHFTITEENLKALQKAREAGIQIALFSGRPLPLLLPISKRLGLWEEGNYSLAYNGALLIENKSEKVISKTAIPTKEAQELASILYDLDLPADAIDVDGSYQFKAPKGFESEYKDINKGAGDLDFYDFDRIANEKDRQFFKIVSATSPEQIQEKLPLLPSDVKERYEIVRSRDNLLEFLPKGTDKGSGIKQLASYLDLSLDEIMSLGDHNNDLSMLQTAGIGVAVGNAIDEAKAIANYITDSNENSGVAKAIYHFLDL